MPSKSIDVTHEWIANMLGERRESDSEAAGTLQHLGLIHYSRGRLSVLDRRGLETRSCECYTMLKREFERLLPTRTECLEPHRSAPVPSIRSETARDFPRADIRSVIGTLPLANC
jgi:hypothetical protein